MEIGLDPKLANNSVIKRLWCNSNHFVIMPKDKSIINRHFSIPIWFSSTIPMEIMQLLFWYYQYLNCPISCMCTLSLAANIDFCMWSKSFELPSIPPSHGSTIWNLASIDLAVLRKRSLKILNLMSDLDHTELPRPIFQIRLRMYVKLPFSLAIDDLPHAQSLTFHQRY